MGGDGDIVVAGAGIGGLTAALALATRGFRVVVCERAERLSEVGAGIQLSPNVSRVLASLGLDAALNAVASEPVAIEVRSGRSGRLVTAIPLPLLHRRYGFPWRVMARAELQTVLAEAVAANPMIELRLGTNIVDFAAGADELLVGTETRAGRSIQPAEAMVAADGVHSALREKIAGATAAKPIGCTAWRATIPARAADAILPAKRIGLWLGRDAHLVHYPIGGGRMVNIVAIVAEDWRGIGWSEPGDHYALAEHFARWAPTARAIIGAPEEWRKWAVLSVDPSGAWVSDRVALLGDAAHAMPPFLAQGAAMAIEDAAVLAACIATRRDDTAAAFRDYEAARRPRTTRLYRAAVATGKQYHLPEPLALFRNTVLRLAGWRLVVQRNDWIYGWKAEA